MRVSLVSQALRRDAWKVCLCITACTINADTVTEVIDPLLTSTSSLAARPLTIVTASNSSFFIANNTPIGHGASDIIGWYYPLEATTNVIEITDPLLSTPLSQTARALNVAAAPNNSFFVANNIALGGVGSRDIIGWSYLGAGTNAIEVVDLNLSTISSLTVRPLNVVSAPNNSFFIANSTQVGNMGFSSDIIGWYYPVGSTTSAIEVIDPLLATISSFQANPSNVVAAPNNSFFITNSSEVGDAGFSSDIIGWYYPSGAPDAIEVTDPNLATLSSLLAQPANVAVSSTNSFFITNRTNVGGGGSDIIGWYYPQGATDAIEVIDPNLATLSSPAAQPQNVVAAPDNSFFIVNQTDIGGMSGSTIIGWYYPQGATDAIEVTDPNLSTISSPAAQPQNVVAAPNSSFFIVNNNPVGGLNGDIIGWYHAVGATTSVIEVVDPLLSTISSPTAVPNNVAVALDNRFFIVNRTNIGSSDSNIVGWSYLPGATDAIQVIDPLLSVLAALPENVVAAPDNSFFIANALTIGLADGGVVGWYYPLGATTSAIEVIDPLAVTASSLIAQPLNVVVAPNNTFFIANSHPVGTVNGDIIGWRYPALPTPPPPPPPVPSSFLPRLTGENAFVSMNLMYAFVDILMADLTIRRFALTEPFGATVVAGTQMDGSETFLAASGEDLPRGSSRRAAESKQTVYCTCPQKQVPNCFWVAGLGNWAQQASRNAIPKFKFHNYGTLFGYEYYGKPNAVIGIAGGYARSKLNFFHDVGDGEINSYVLGPYGTGYLWNGYIEAGLFGTFNQNENRRNLLLGVAKSSHDSYQLTGHFGLGYDFVRGGTSLKILEPFATLDYVADWESSYTETGAGIANAEVHKKTIGMLRTEAGLRLYEVFNRSWGVYILKETVGYVNKTPYGTKHFVAGYTFTPLLGTFETFTQSQNLLNVGFEMFLKANGGRFGSFTYNTELLSGYFSNTAELTFGMFF